jgi:hypothetical protein
MPPGIVVIEAQPHLKAVRAGNGPPGYRRTAA